MLKSAARLKSLAPDTITVADPLALSGCMPARERVPALVNGHTGGRVHRNGASNGVRALTFAYFDSAGAPTSDPAAVRRVRVTLSTRADHAPSAATAGLGATLTTEIQLRNR